LGPLIDKSLEFREDVSKNPEKDYNKDIIFAQLPEASEVDYIVYFSLSLLEACSMNAKIPVLISRILLNNLIMMMEERDLKFNNLH
jgi:hypothetical protein